MRKQTLHSSIHGIISLYSDRGRKYLVLGNPKSFNPVTDDYESEIRDDNKLDENCYLNGFLILDRGLKHYYIIGGGLGALNVELKKHYIKSTSIEIDRAIADLSREITNSDVIVGDGSDLTLMPNDCDIIIIDAFDKNSRSLVKVFTEEPFIREAIKKVDFLAYNCLGFKSKGINNLTSLVRDIAKEEGKSLIMSLQRKFDYEQTVVIYELVKDKK